MTLIKTTTAAVVVLFSLGASAVAPVAEAGSERSNSALASTQSDMSLEQRVARLERMLQGRNQSQLAMQNQLDENIEGISDISGQIEQLDYQIEQMVVRQRELYQELDRRFAQLQDSNVVAAAPASQTGEPNASAEKDYDAAVDLVMTARDYDAAIPAFEAFVKDYPESEYVSNSHYWLGQLFYTRGQREKAAEQFNIVLDKFPDSGKRPEALLKLGMIAKHQKDVPLAKQYFEQVIADFPNSTEAGLAAKELN